MRNRRGATALGATLGLAVGALAFTTTAHADASDALAPPGPCAEPRQALRAEPIEAKDTFAVSGSPLRHFDPRDVAAGSGGPSPPDFEAPVPPTFARAACDSPDAGCIDRLTPPRTLVESDAGSGCPPGADCR